MICHGGDHRVICLPRPVLSSLFELSSGITASPNALTMLRNVMNDTQAAGAALLHLVACLLLLALLLQLPISQNRMFRTAAGLVITFVTLLSHPPVYASDTQIFSPVLAFLCAQIALTMLHWTFLQPLDRRPSMLDVVFSHMKFSMHGVRKVYQRSLRKASEKAGSSTSSGTAAAAERSTACTANATTDPARSRMPHQGAVRAFNRKDNPSLTSHRDDQPWVFAVLKALEAVVKVSLWYDLTFYILCSVSNFCDPANSGTALFGSIRKATAAAAGGSFVQRLGPGAAAYLPLCLYSILAAAPMGMQLNLVYCWVDLVLHVAAGAVPQLRQYCAELPFSAFNRPWATTSLKELWGIRWHQFLRFYYEGLGYATVDKILWLWREDGRVASLRSIMRGASAFFISAITHEYVTWAAYGAFTGCYMAFFGLQFVAVMVEGAFVSAVAPHLPAILQRYSKLFGRIYGWTVCGLMAPLFFEPFRVTGFYSRCAIHPFGTSLTAKAVSWLQAAARG